MYRILDKGSLPAYLDELPAVVEVLGKGADLDIEEVGDGNLNFVFKVRRVDDPAKSVVVKQAVPYLRMVGEEWPLSKERMTFEIRALTKYNELIPNHVPTIYHADEEMSVLVMECLNDHIILRLGMIDGVTYPDVAEHIGLFMAETLFKTSSLGMDSLERRHLMGRFVLNDELCKLTEEFIFTFPYMEHDSNYSNPTTDAWARANLRNDSEYKLGVLHFKDQFLSKADALLHADMHSGSVMVNQTESYVIDMEFAFFGPFGFDVGKVMANFLMCCTSHYYRSTDDTYREWILTQTFKIWETFAARFLELWAEHGESAMLLDGLLTEAELAKYKTQFMLDLLHETVGFAACSMARRTLGIAGVADIRDIEDAEIRAQLEITNLELSKLLMAQHGSTNTVGEFEAMVRSFYDSKSFDF